MSRITFNFVEFKNFQSFGNNLTHVNLDQDQISLICGTNGAGKTCVIQTISYALFGKSLTGITKSELINNKNKKNLYVKLKFTIGESEYELERGDKPSILVLHKDGKEVEIEGDSRIFQKHLEEDVLGFNFKSFKQLVCLGADFTRFFKMTASERRTFIEGILDLQVISEMNTMAKEDLKSVKTNIDNIEIDYHQKESNLKIYEEEQAKEQQNITERKDKLLDEKTKLEEEVVELEKESAIKKKEKDHLEVLETEANKNYNDVFNTLSKIDSQLKIGKSKLEELNTEVDFFKHHQECPTCKQHINEEFISQRLKDLDKKIAKINDKIGEITALRDDNNEKLEFYNKSKKEVYTAKLEAVSALSKVSTSISEKRKRISSIDVEVATLDSNKPGGSREQAIFNLKTELEDLSNKKKNFEKRKFVYEQILQILSDSGVKQAIIMNYIDYINQQLAKYLERFNFNFSIEFDSEFNDTILMDFRDPVQYESLSEGQKARLEFCILMVWRDIARTRNSVSTNLLSIDELFDSALDDSGMQDMIDVLKGEQGNIFVISHKNVKSMFEHIYEIQKEKYGFSELKEL